MKVQVVSYKGRGAGSKIIIWFTRGKCSHISLRFKDVEKEVRDWAFEKFAFRMTNDFEIESIQKQGVIAHPFVESDNQTIYNFEQSSEQSRVILKSAIGLVGKKYDYRGALAFLSRRKTHNLLRWFCSELAAWCLLKAGIILLWLPPYQQSPSALVSSTVLTEV